MVRVSIKNYDHLTKEIVYGALNTMKLSVSLFIGLFWVFHFEIGFLHFLMITYWDGIAFSLYKTVFLIGVLIIKVCQFKSFSISNTCTVCTL